MRTLRECFRLSKYCAILTKCKISHFPINITTSKKCNWLVYLYMYVSRTTILASCWEFFCGFRSGINYHIKKLSANMKLYMLVLKLDGLNSFKNSGKKLGKLDNWLAPKMIKVNFLLTNLFSSTYVIYWYFLRTISTMAANKNKESLLFIFFFVFCKKIKRKKLKKEIWLNCILFFNFPEFLQNSLR